MCTTKSGTLKSNLVLMRRHAAAAAALEAWRLSGAREHAVLMLAVFCNFIITYTHIRVFNKQQNTFVYFILNSDDADANDIYASGPCSSRAFYIKFTIQSHACMLDRHDFMVF